MFSSGNDSPDTTDFPTRFPGLASALGSNCEEFVELLTRSTQMVEVLLEDYSVSRFYSLREELKRYRIEKTHFDPAAQELPPACWGDDWIVE